MLIQSVSKIPSRLFGTVSHHTVRFRTLFYGQSSHRLKAEKYGLETIQTVANSKLFKWLEPLLLEETSNPLTAGFVKTVKFASTPVIQYFCKPSIVDLESLNKHVMSEIVATNLSEHIHSNRQGDQNKVTLKRDLSSSIQYFAVKPSAVCRQSALETKANDYPEQVEMRDYYSQLIRLASEKNKTIILDAEGRQTKSAYDRLVNEILSQKLSPIFTIQASYTDALDTLERYVDWANYHKVPLQYKIVKGAYVTHDQTNLETSKHTCQTFEDTHKQYLALIEASLTLGLRPIIASHNNELLEIAEKESLETGNLLGLEVKQTTFTVAPYGDFNDAFHWSLRRLNSGVDGTRKRIDAIQREILNRN